MKRNFNLDKLLSFDFNQSDLTPKRIKDIRKIYKVTQVAFAELIMVRYETYRSWEEGRRVPSSPGYAILRLFNKLCQSHFLPF
mgnify:CR=1 FL=1